MVMVAFLANRETRRNSNNRFTGTWVNALKISSFLSIQQITLQSRGSSQK